MENKYGLLINKDAKLHRQYFSEMCKLLGIMCIYRSPKEGRKWTTYGELEDNFNSPMAVPCIFNEHVDQRTMKKLGWVPELDTQASAISVPYDLPNIQVGSIFVVPSGIDNAEGRVFRVVEMSNQMIYPSSITCKIVPEYENNFNRELRDHKTNSLNLLNEEGDGTI